MLYLRRGSGCSSLERMTPYMNDTKKMPFDGKRMVYGGFKSFVEK